MVIVKDSRKKIIMICIFCILLFLIVIISIKIYQGNKQKKEMEELRHQVLGYSSIEDFKSVQEVALYLDCELIGIEDCEQDNARYNVKMRISKRLGDEGAKQVYEKLVQYCAYVLKYEDFYIIDEDSGIVIFILCNKDSGLVSKYFINSDENYFKNVESKGAINNSTVIENASIQVKIESDILNKIVKNNWQVPENIGVAESQFDKYDIYFDEGFKIRKVNNSVYNIVFDDNYNQNIINNVGTKSTKKEIEKNLGKPQFELSELIGYKLKNMYVFFYKNQVSVYQCKQYNTEKIAQFFEQYNDDKNFEKLINKVKDVWKDYDVYEYGSNYILLQYSNKGIAFKYGVDNNNGIYLYNNYAGKVSPTETLEQVIQDKSNLYKNMYYEDKDLVFEAEKKRLETQYDTTSNNNISSKAVANTSTKFKVAKDKENDVYEIKFIAIDNKYPNSELKEKINKGIWFNDSTFIYQIKNRGIFAYNAENRTYSTIISGSDDFNIYYIENNTLFYDDTSVKIEL